MAQPPEIQPLDNGRYHVPTSGVPSLTRGQTISHLVAHHTYTLTEAAAHVDQLTEADTPAS